MSDSEMGPELKAAVRRLLQNQRPQTHPSADELIAFDSGGLSAEEMEEIRGHLPSCPDCTQALLDLAGFPDLPLRRDDISRTTQQAEEDWKTIENEVRSHRPHFPKPLAAVAALLFVSILMSVWVLQLRHEVQQLSLPKANVFTLELNSVESGVTRSVERDPAEVPSEMTAILLTLNPGAIADYPSYELEIRKSSGELVWSGRVHPLPNLSFTVEMPDGFLQDGEYQMELFGIREGSRELLATFRAAIRHAGRS